MLNLIKFDESRPIIARAAGRAVIGSANFSMRSLCEAILRQTRFGTPVVEASGIDGHNEEISREAEKQEEVRARIEQGHDVEMPLMEQAGLLKVVRDAINSDLIDHADQKALITDPSKTIPDPFHVGGTFEESIEFQLRQTVNMPSKAMIEAEAAALNVSVEDIHRAVIDRHARQISYLKENKADIISMYHSLRPIGPDGHPWGLMDAIAVFDRLPAMTRLRLYKSADTGLFKQRDREIQRHLGVSKGSERSGDAAGNVALIDGTRRELLLEVAELYKNETFKRDIERAQARGANLPTFSPAPHVQKPDSKEIAIEKRKAA